MQCYSNVSCVSQSTKDKNSSVGMATVNNFDFLNERHVTKNEEEHVRVGALSNR